MCMPLIQSCPVTTKLKLTRFTGAKEAWSGHSMTNLEWLGHLTIKVVFLGLVCKVKVTEKWSGHSLTSLTMSSPLVEASYL